MGVCSTKKKVGDSMAQKNERELIKKDLLEQLKEKGLTRKYYISLVDDYMTLWDLKNQLSDNIKENGVMLTYNHGGGQSGQKKNDCVPEFYRVNKQMLSLLSELGLRGANVEPEKEEFEL